MQKLIARIMALEAELEALEAVLREMDDFAPPSDNGLATSFRRSERAQRVSAVLQSDSFLFYRCGT